MRRVVAALALGLVPGLVLGTACEPVDSGAAQPLRVAPPAGGLPFTRFDPRLTVAHAGTRTLDFPQVAGPGGAFRERIVTDGHGRFALVPLDDGTLPPLEWEAFELFQRVRAGFLFRYRDFQVRDPQLFARNWSLTRLDPTTRIAGRECERYRIEHAAGEAHAFEIAVDPPTGLVLATEEFDAAGQRIAAMTYETLELDPDLSAVAWHERGNAEQVLDPLVSLEEQLASRLLRPRLLPPGYEELEAATVEEEQGKRWLKLTYSDGIEPLFFLQVLPDPSKRTTAQSGDRSEGGLRPSASSVVVFEVGTATAVQGEVDGFELIVIGEAPEAELLDLIESSLP